MSSDPTHVLYLGLRHGDERWNLMPLDVNAEKEKIALRLTDNSEEKMEPKRRGRKDRMKCKKMRGGMIECSGLDWDFV